MKEGIRQLETRLTFADFTKHDKSHWLGGFLELRGHIGLSRGTSSTPRITIRSRPSGYPALAELAKILDIDTYSSNSPGYLSPRYEKTREILALMQNTAPSWQQVMQYIFWRVSAQTVKEKKLAALDYERYCNGRIYPENPEVYKNLVNEGAFIAGLLDAHGVYLPAKRPGNTRVMFKTSNRALLFALNKLYMGHAVATEQTSYRWQMGVTDTKAFLNKAAPFIQLNFPPQTLL